MKNPLKSSFGQWFLILFAVVVVGFNVLLTANIAQNIAQGRKKYPQIVAIADPSNSGRYVTDGEYVYDNNQIIAGATLNDFRTFENTDYAVDSTAVFFDDEPIMGADPVSFVALGDGGYARDVYAVYYDGVKIAADPISFAVFNSVDCDCSDYAKDKNTVYYEGAALTGSDPLTFSYLGEGYAIDAHAVYYNDSVVAGADVSTFVLNPSDDESDTANSAYYDAKDKNHEYYEGVRVK